MRFIRRFIGWAAHWAARSVWWPLGAKALAALAAFAALAHVGAGAATRLTDVGPGAEPTAAAAPNIGTLTSTAARAKPSTDPSAASPSASCRRATAPPSNAFTIDGLLILNRANATDLQKLPRVGEKRAQAIIALREKLGRFRHVRDLLRIRGIGYRMLKKLEPLVVVDAPDEGAKKAKPKA